MGSQYILAHSTRWPMVLRRASPARSHVTISLCPGECVVGNGVRVAYGAAATVVQNALRLRVVVAAARSSANACQD
eukprot:2861688-Lingulodinium_polyedra.AAC.1